MKIKVKKLNKNFITPSKAYPGDVGVDLTACSKKYVLENGYEYVEYGLGFAMTVPEGYGGFLFPRSSCRKTGMTLANCVGVIEPTYTGEVKASFKRIPGLAEYEIGDRCCQLVVIKVEDLNFEEVNELKKTLRGGKGHGSSGK